MGTLLQLNQLITKLRGQARGLPGIAGMMEAILGDYEDVHYRYSL
jgi:hypothetical protein